MFAIRFVESILQMGKKYSGHSYIWKRHKIRSIVMVCGRCKECMELDENCRKQCSVFM